jgi:uncharacterized iron-regulated protein
VSLARRTSGSFVEGPALSQLKKKNTHAVEKELTSFCAVSAGDKASRMATRL